MSAEKWPQLIDENWTLVVPMATTILRVRHPTGRTERALLAGRVASMAAHLISGDLT